MASTLKWLSDKKKRRTGIITHKTTKNTEKMKHILKSIAALVVAPLLLATATSCESMDETNTDPTRMDDATAGSFMDPVIYNMAVYTWTRYNSWTFPIMQSIVTTNVTSGVGWFKVSDTAGDGVWTTYYKWNTNAKAIYDKAVEAGDPNYKAIAMTLRSWIFENTTDAFGDIPVSESCRGEEQLYYPKFETQAEAYKYIFEQLDSANILYEPSKGLQFNTSGDKMYCTSNSDAEGIRKWRKFTNSLRLRALLRVIDAPELSQYAKTELKKMLDDPTTYPVFESNDDNAQVHISGTAPDEAPMTRPSDLTSYRAYSSFFIDKLNEWNDPRLPIFANKATNKNPETGKDEKSYVGIQSGYLVEPTINGSTPNATTLATAPQDIYCLTYAEVQFIKAELAQRGIISGDAKTFYEEGVKASVEQWGATLAPDYFDNEAAAYDGTLKRIMEQKFYALFFTDFQQWFEYNRTGYPEVPKGPGIDANDHMPFRFKYPSIIQRINREHYLEAVQSMGGDDFQTRLIWQKRNEL